MNSQQVISKKAYELWEADGRQPGRDLEYWTRAESEIYSARKRKNGGSSGLNLGVCGTFKMVSWIKKSLELEINCHTGGVQKRKNLAVWRANIHSWKLAQLLNDVPVVKMNRKLPRIHNYVLFHKNKFKSKTMRDYYAKSN